MTDGASQSAIDLHRKNARDPQNAFHLNQTRMPCIGGCSSGHCVFAVIMPEGAWGVAPPEFIKWVDYSENRTCTSPCELDSRCLSGGTCKRSGILLSPDPLICHSTVFPAIPMRYHTVLHRHRVEVAKYARCQTRRRPRTPWWSASCGPARPTSRVELRGVPAQLPS